MKMIGRFYSEIFENWDKFEIQIYLQNLKAHEILQVF